MRKHVKWLFYGVYALTGLVVARPSSAPFDPLAVVNSWLANPTPLSPKQISAVEDFLRTYSAPGAGISQEISFIESMLHFTPTGLGTKHPPGKPTNTPNVSASDPPPPPRISLSHPHPKIPHVLPPSATTTATSSPSPPDPKPSKTAQMSPSPSPPPPKPPASPASPPPSPPAPKSTSHVPSIYRPAPPHLSSAFDWNMPPATMKTWTSWTKSYTNPDNGFRRVTTVITVCEMGQEVGDGGLCSFAAEDPPVYWTTATFQIVTAAFS